MPSRKMRTAIYLFYGLDVEIRPKMDPPELFIHLGGAIGILSNLLNLCQASIIVLPCVLTLGRNISTVMVGLRVHPCTAPSAFELHMMDVPHY